MSNTMLFNPGNIYCTKSIQDFSEVMPEFWNFCTNSLLRHLRGDWGNLCPEDCVMNDNAVHSGERILSSYSYPENSELDIWIITEYDRSATTILFPSEY